MDFLGESTDSTYYFGYKISSHRIQWYLSENVANFSKYATTRNLHTRVFIFTATIFYVNFYGDFF